MAQKQQSKQTVEDRDFMLYNTDEDVREVYGELTDKYERNFTWKETYDEYND